MRFGYWSSASGSGFNTRRGKLLISGCTESSPQAGPGAPGWRHKGGFERTSVRLLLVMLFATAIAIVGSRNRTALAAEHSGAMHAAANSITQRDMKRHVDLLADDTFEGRAAGTRGGRAASVYLRQTLSNYDLEPMGTDGDFFQYFRGNYRNVLAKIEGGDPELKNEFILIGAHYDHVGYGNSKNSYGPTGYIHNGADDNASGTAALLELAEALTLLDTPPRRSLLIAFWDGEEQGLLGSKHFVANPSVSLDRVKMMINMDMVGRLRDDTLKIYGSRTTAGSRQFVSRLNSGTDMKLDFDWEIKANSDHHPFFVRRIPYLMPHTGLHDDYHRPRDDAHKINSAGMEKIGRLLLAMVHQLGNQEDISPFRDQANKELPATQRELARPLPPLPKRLGLSWQSAESAPNGLLVTQTHYRSPAATAGLRRGDRIVRFADRVIDGNDSMLAAVFGATNPVRVLVARNGEAEPVALSVQLDGRPMRLGISWRTDDAEPGTVILNRVVPGSPAALAGMRVNDRVYEIDGQTFIDGVDFGQRLQTREFPIPLLVERQGRLQTLVLEALPGDADNELAAR